MISVRLNNLRNVCGLHNNFLNTLCKHFSAKPPTTPIQKNAEGETQKRPKSQPVPKITLIVNDDNMSITTLEEAQHMSKRRALKLVKLVDMDNKTQRPVYKLMTGAEYNTEDLKSRQTKKQDKLSNALKGEKLLMLNVQISKHDLEVHVKKIIKWIAKRFEVRVTINGDANNAEKSEAIYKFLEDNLKTETRFLQKRMKGGDLKFQIIPPKADDAGSNKTL
ncbi:hypothetical protein PPYR_06883 [Photinus pyralis]|uniref:Translation initiation factor 3 N-terminal domain-containing protein n=1 Tax=Photinus pyralis TaxID=7054 RepID=A0A5N4ANZ0_PHOPY|nr:translation initiation factor IF-3, mitochondrial [Photinus pyralis]KAB0799003.1 hypothetical protein PPYR_06883 [Photinus pyralis]